ncbi:PEP-CTERM/exosortase system-associated acyltransferase [Catenovulum sp. 2E275]|uniref:PEP-CTERM/exosortase system-associated acyltransferase n=1 Tax=Catenovulum sp. 2E275 TaxID=2980497 RepID=UPI0021D3BEF5|nr:PEP-CTERM/exosortase system-associated acyltransferase [Catenovulum sp. 2E275]MCU4675567.1 PEP-CTERM/exosortase system-associated acyltransferase [Catenovulum sp. 2E275]
MKSLRKYAEKPIIGPIIKKAMKYFVNREVDSIATHFSQFLIPRLAYTQEMQNEVFKIRHNVYCDELSFLEKHTSGLETDGFDSHSLHCAIEHKPTQSFAGTVRLVYSPNAQKKLPIEAFCINSISKDEVHPSDFPRDQIFEISRLAIPAHFRRRNTDKFKGSATGVINEQVYSEDELRCFPFIAIGLYLSAAALSQHQGMEHCFVMMEPRLARSLKFVGIPFRQIGPAVEYHGKRAPYYITNTIFMNSLSSGFKKLFFSIEDELESQFDIASTTKTEYPAQPAVQLLTQPQEFVSLTGERLFHV